MPQPRTYQKTILEPSNYQTIFTKQKPSDQYVNILRPAY